jgi:hypothetical protein
MTSSSEPSTVAARGRAQAPWWAQRVHAVSDYLTIDFLGGPRPLKFAWVIDFQKVGTFVLYGFLLWYYHQRSIAAWIYAAMHGSYGLIWLMAPHIRSVTAALSVARPYLVLSLHQHLYGGVCHHDCCGRAKILHSLAATWTYYRWDVPVHSPSELSRRNVDLWELCDDGLALAAGSGAYLGVERSFRGQHDHEKGEHVALPRMASLPGTHRLAPAQVRFDEADERITPHGTVLI